MKRTCEMITNVSCFTPQHGVDYPFAIVIIFIMFPLSKRQILATLRQLRNGCRRIASYQGTNNIKLKEESFVRSANVKVCSRFSQYHPLRRPWFLRYIPEGGYPLRIDYIDTKPDVDVDDEGIKTIVILHGTPGSYYDFFKLLATFGDAYRIIVPNFPNFTHTAETGCFWHSAEEKSEFVADFLRHLNVHVVDCLIAHSMAAYAASYLWIYANWDTYFKLGSICLLSPVGLYKIKRLEQMRLSLVANGCRSPKLRSLLPKRIMSKSAKSTNHIGISDNFDISAWTALTTKLANLEQYSLRLTVLAKYKIPTLFAYSSNDKLYPAHVFEGQLFQLGATYQNFDVYEQYENELIQSADDNSWLKVVDFRSAGHYMFNTHPDIIHSYIAELITRSKIEPTKKKIEKINKKS